MSEMKEAAAQSEPAKAPTDAFFMVRMVVLGVVFVVMLGALGWEYGYVVPGFNGAQDKLTEMSDENIKLKAEDAKTMADVQKIVGGKKPEVKIISPAKKKSADDVSMRAQNFIRHDKYTWSHALPWKKPETISIVYKRLMRDDSELDKDAESFDAAEWKFSAVYFNEDPPAGGLRSVSRDATNPGDTPSTVGAGSGRGGGGGGGRGGGGRGGAGGGKKGGKSRPQADEDKSEKKDPKTENKTEDKTGNKPEPKTEVDNK